MAGGSDTPSVAVPSGRNVYASPLQATVVLPAVAADLTLPSVTVPSTPIPSAASLAKVYAAISWRMQIDSSGAQNAVNGAQNIQLQLNGASAWTTCIAVVDNSFLTGASATVGGLLVIGTVDVSAVVTAAGQYDFQWASALVDGASLTLYDVQTFLIAQYS